MTAILLACLLTAWRFLIMFKDSLETAMDVNAWVSQIGIAVGEEDRGAVLDIKNRILMDYIGNDADIYSDLYMLVSAVWLEMASTDAVAIYDEFYDMLLQLNPILRVELEMTLNKASYEDAAVMVILADMGGELV